MRRVAPVDEEGNNTTSAFSPRIGHAPSQSTAVLPTSTPAHRLAKVDTHCPRSCHEIVEIGDGGTPCHQTRCLQGVKPEPPWAIRGRLIRIEADDLHIVMRPESDEAVSCSEAGVTSPEGHLDAQECLNVTHPLLEIGGSED